MLLEVFKSVHSLNPSFMSQIFQEKGLVYSLRQGHTLKVPRVKCSIGLNSFELRGSLAWNHVPSELKAHAQLEDFRSSLSDYSVYCQCKFCVALPSSPE